MAVIALCAGKFGPWGPGRLLLIAYAPGKKMKCQTLHATEYLQSESDINIHKSVVEHCYAMHTHDFIELGFITAGKGTHIVNNQSYHIEKGDLFILNANIPHAFEADDNMPIIVYNCIFQPSSIDGSFMGKQDFSDIASRYLFHTLNKSDDSKEYIKLSGSSTQEIKILLDDIYKEYRQRHKGFMQVIRSDLTKLLILVFRLYRSDKEQAQSQPLFRRLVVKNTLAYMRNRYDRNITCEQLAERSYLSLSYLSRIFKEETGLSMIQMLQQIRIEAAKEMLESTIFTVDEIASRVGYSDLKHFYHIFHRLAGCTPGKYRSMFQK